MKKDALEMYNAEEAEAHRGEMGVRERGARTMKGAGDMKTQEELRGMTMRDLRAYAKEIGCCLGYDGSRKDAAIGAIMAYERLRQIERGEGGRHGE